MLSPPLSRPLLFILFDVLLYCNEHLWITNCEMLNCDIYMYNVTARVLYVCYIRKRMRKKGEEMGREKITLLIDEPCMYNDRMNDIFDD